MAKPKKRNLKQWKMSGKAKEKDIMAIRIWQFFFI